MATPGRPTPSIAGSASSPRRSAVARVRIDRGRSSDCPRLDGPILHRRREPRLERRRAAHRRAGSPLRSAGGSTGSASRRRSTGRSSGGCCGQRASSGRARRAPTSRRSGRPAGPRRGHVLIVFPEGTRSPTARSRRPRTARRSSPSGPGAGSSRSASRARDRVLAARPADARIRRRRVVAPGRRAVHARARRRPRRRPAGAPSRGDDRDHGPDRGPAPGPPARRLRADGRRRTVRPAEGSSRGPRAIIEPDGYRRRGPDRQADRLLLRRARGDRQGQGGRRGRQATHTLGQVVHNEGVIRDLEQIGIQTVETLDDVDHGAAVVIRAHGVRPEVMERAEARGLEVIDGTCTWVIQEQRELVRLVEEGYTIVLLGTPQASRGRRPARLRAGRDRRRRGGGLGPRSRDARRWRSSPRAPSRPGSSRGSPRTWSSRSHELKIVNTVCPVTIRRQEDTLETAREVDLMVVVGGRSSANTKELTRLCEIAGTPAIQIEGVRDLADAGGVRGRPGRRRDRRHVDADRGPPGRRPSGSSSWPGPTDAAARADELALTRRSRPPRRPAGRTTSLPARDPTRRRRLRRGLSVPPSDGRAPGRRHRRPAERRQEHALQPDRRRRATRSSRTGPGRPATGCTARPSGTAGGSWSSTPAGSRSSPATRSRPRSRSRPAWRSPRPTSSSSSSTPSTGLTPADLEAAELLRRATAPVLVAVNKADNERRELEAAEFYALGWEETYPISRGPRAGRRPTCSTRSSGRCRRSPSRGRPQGARGARPTQWARDVADGLPRAVSSSATSRRRGRRREPTEAWRRDRAAGRPGSGTPRSPPRPTRRPSRSRSSAGRTSASRACSTRSSARSGRSCRDIPGTTRDAIDTHARVGPERDRPHRHGRHAASRQGRLGPAAERFSTLRALRAIARADVAVLVIDAVDGLTAQDAHVAGYVVEEGKGLVVAVNKWDLAGREDRPDASTSTSRGSAARRRSSTSRRSSRSAPRPGSASGACSRPRSTSGASGAGGSRPASSTGSSARPSARQPPPLVKGQPAEDLLRHPGGRRAADVRRSSRATPGASTSATGATSRTGCARRSASTARRSGSSSASGASVELPRRRAAPGAPPAAAAGDAGRRPAAEGRSAPGRAATAGGRATARRDGRRGSPSSAPGRGARRWRSSSPGASRSRCSAPLRRRRAAGATSRRTSAHLPGIELPGRGQRDGRSGGARRRAELVVFAVPSRPPARDGRRGSRRSIRRRRDVAVASSRASRPGRCCG